MGADRAVVPLLWGLLVAASPAQCKVPTIGLFSKIVAVIGGKVREHQPRFSPESTGHIAYETGIEHINYVIITSGNIVYEPLMHSMHWSFMGQVGRELKTSLYLVYLL